MIEDRFAYFEWSAPPDSDIDDQGALWTANPSTAVGRITEEFSRVEREAMSDEEYARERLGIFPDNDDAPRWEVFSEEQWTKAQRPAVRPWIVGPITYAVEATPDGSAAAIGCAGIHPDGDVAVQVGEHREGRAWLPGRIVDIDQRRGPASWLIDPNGPVGPYVRDLVDAGIDVVEVSMAEYAQACSGFYDAVIEDTVHHHGQDELDAAVAQAKKRTRGDVWIWDRRDLDVTCLAVVTLARWGHLTITPPETEGDFIAV